MTVKSSQVNYAKGSHIRQQIGDTHGSPEEQDVSQRVIQLLKDQLSHLPPEVALRIEKLEAEVRSLLDMLDQKERIIFEKEQQIKLLNEMMEMLRGMRNQEGK